MVFSSTAFLFVFLPAVLVLVYPLARAPQNAALLAFSLVFYVWGAGTGLWAIALVALVSWAGALVLARCSGRWSGVAFASVVLAVVGPLVMLKYWPVVRGAASPTAADVAVPLGISFFTFHALSYLADVRRAALRPDARADHYLVYLFLFPHQIAGPIVRYSELVDEIKARARPAWPDVAYGLGRFGWGLAKKVVVADSAGALADACWSTLASPSPGHGPGAPAAWLGAFAYTTQIYFDFSGYSDMAIGLARVFGFHFPENFAGPYRAASATEFWRRWHMTLSRWFRDYVYVPLGGNRHGRVREYVALIVTFALTALWHGATGPFLVWGGLWSAALLVERVTGLRVVSSRWRPLRRVAMLLFIVVTWVPFRSPTQLEALAMWRAMLTGGWSWPSPQMLVSCTPVAIAALALGLLAFVLPAPHGRVFDSLVVATDGPVRISRALSVGLGAGLAGLMFAIASTGASPFLYFRF
jgi:alginate O-acetyltransferase complex protein AlgI